MINKKFQLWTRIFIGVIVAVIVIYDVFIIIKGGTGTTISHELIVWAYHYPILPFSLGVIFGHLMWRMPSTPDTAEIDPYVKGLKEAAEFAKLEFERANPFYQNILAWQKLRDALEKI